MFEWSCHGFDAFGNIVVEVFSYAHRKHGPDDPPGSAVTEVEYQTGIEKIKVLDKPLMCTGHPELHEMQVAGIRASVTGVYTTGFDFQQGVKTVLPTFTLNLAAEKPFSFSQNMLVPVNGIRLRPKHRARPDDFDEAVCMMGLVRALVVRRMAAAPAAT